MKTVQTVLSGTSSHDVQRWTPPDVSIPPPLSHDAPEPLVQPPTADEVAAIKEAARVQGNEAGYQAGYQAGYDTGERAAQETVEQDAEHERQARAAREAEQLAYQEDTLRETVAALESIAQALADPLANTADALEPELLALTTTLARRVIMEELRLRPELIQGVLRQALAQLPSRLHAVRVHVHPDEQATLAAYAASCDENLTWVADPAIERGGCLIDSGPSRIDASLDTRLRQSIDAIWGELEPPPSAPAEISDPVLDVEPAPAAPAEISDPVPEVPKAVAPIPESPPRTPPQQRPVIEPVVDAPRQRAPAPEVPMASAPEPNA